MLRNVARHGANGEEKQMNTSQNAQRNNDDVELAEIVESESTYQTDDTWGEDLDDEDDEDDDGDLIDAAFGKTPKPIVGWASDMLRALGTARYVGGDVLPAFKLWALAAKGAVMQCWGDWTGHQKAIAETQKVLNKSGCVYVRKPVETSLHEKRLLKAKLVKRITNEEGHSATRRD
jgi:hypothetical protein